MRTIRRIYIHHTARDRGSVEGIRRFHVEQRGWSDIGYHWVIGNGRGMADGKISPGRPEARAGAHVAGDNQHTLGVVLIGNGNFTPAQRGALLNLLIEKCLQFDVDPQDVLGHREHAKASTVCPGFRVSELRAALRPALQWAA